MASKSKVLFWFIVVLSAFLLGLIPQAFQKQKLFSELSSVNERLLSTGRDLKMVELRDLCGLMLLEVLRRNYGSASNYSTQYFEKVRQAASEAQDPARKNGLEDLLHSRDSITAALAQGDPASASEIQALFA